MAGWVAGEDITADKLNDNSHFLVEYQAITANSAAATAETVWVTTASVTFRNNRAYRITTKCLLQAVSAADRGTVRVRKTNTSGTTYVDSFQITPPAASANAPVFFQNICTNTTGADVSAALVGTFIRATGAGGNFLVAATSTHVAYVSVEDVGPAADYPSATAIT